LQGQGFDAKAMLVMPPNEPCPHCGQLIRDWHNEWYDPAQRRAIYSGKAAMDCPLCRQPVLWFQSRGVAAPAGNAQVQVYKRSASIAAQWVPIREATCGNLAGYISSHPAGQQYRGYWQASVIEQADQQATKP
jgi:endogenous inhibitor of DNA gyrase (YacG/DUF329 family)